MRIGIFVNACGSLHTGAVWGEEVIANDLKKYMARNPEVYFVEYYGLNGERTISQAPKDFDAVIHMDPELPMDHSNVNIIVHEISDKYRVGGINYYDKYDWRFSYGRRFSTIPRASFFPVPVDTEMFIPRKTGAEFKGACFVGNTVDVQSLYVAPLMDKVPTIVRGCFNQPPLDHDKLPELYNSVNICLNRHRPDHLYFDMFNNRTVETTACGTLCISDAVDVERDLFGDSIVTTTGGDDLVDKVKYYLEHDEERKTLATKAMYVTRQLFSAEHAATTLVAKLLELTGN